TPSRNTVRVGIFRHELSLGHIRVLPPIQVIVQPQGDFFAQRPHIVGAYVQGLQVSGVRPIRPRVVGDLDVADDGDTAVNGNVGDRVGVRGDDAGDVRLGAPIKSTYTAVVGGGEVGDDVQSKSVGSKRQGSHR